MYASAVDDELRYQLAVTSFMLIYSCHDSLVIFLVLFVLFSQISPCTRGGINRISLQGCDARVFCLGVRIVKRRTVQHVG